MDIVSELGKELGTEDLLKSEQGQCAGRKDKDELGSKPFY